MAYLLIGVALGTVLLWGSRAWMRANARSTDDLRPGGRPAPKVSAGTAGTAVPFLGVPRHDPSLSAGWSCATEAAAANDFNGIWGTAADNVFIVGGKGTILRFDGTRLHRMESGTKEALTAVWGFSASEVFAVGGRGTIPRYDGARWSRSKSGTQKRLRAVWGADPRCVYAVGDIALRFDGAQWTTVDVGIEGPFAAVWGSGQNDVYVVGAGGVLAHYDGTAWSSTATGQDGLSCAWGTGPDAVVVAGGDIGEGVILTRAGAGWEETHLEEWPVALWGAQTAGWYAVDWDGAILQRDTNAGAMWRVVHRSGAGNFTAIWGASKDAIFAVGQKGAFLRFDGTEWLSLNPTAELTFKRVTAMPSGEVYVAESRGIYRFDGRGWTRVLEVAPDEGVQDLWVGGDGQLFVVGAVDGRGFVLRYDGATWHRTDTGSPLFAIAGKDASKLVATTFGGLYTFDGKSWAFLHTGRTCQKATVDDTGGVWAVDNDRLVLIRDGEWTTIDSDLAKTFYGVWARTASDVFAVGQDGLIARYDGRSWVKMDSGIEQTLYCVWGLATDEVYAAGHDGTVLRFDGSTWQALDSGTDVAFFDIGAREPGEVWFVGGGSILRWSRSDAHETVGARPSA